MTPELEVLAQRLEAAEKQIAYLAALVVEQSDADRTVVAKRFVVRDTQGVRRAELGIPGISGSETGSHPWLGLFDANENLRACMGVGSERPGDSTVESWPWIELYNEKNTTAVEIRVDANGPKMRMFDANGKPTIGATATKDGSIVVVSNPNGEQCLSIGISSSGAPWLVMEDANGDKVLKLAVESGGPSLLFAKENNVFWSAP